MTKFLVISIVGVVIAAGVGGLWYFTHDNRDQAGEVMAFINLYAEYREVADQQEALLRSPGDSSNRHRSALHHELTTILTGEVEAKERHRVAQTALEHVTQLKAEIDEAAQIRERVEGKMADLGQRIDMLRGTFERTVADAMLKEMQHRHEIIADSLATLYAINGQTEQIVSRIDQADGMLHDDLVVQINNMTADAETRYDRLVILYEELKESNRKLAELANKLAQFAV